MSAIRTSIFALLALLTAACDAEQPDTTPASASDVQDVRAALADVEAAATEYRTAMGSPDMRSPSDCRRAHDAYDARVRPTLEAMGPMGERMDQLMGHHGGADSRDTTCMMAGMLGELDRHQVGACQAADMAGDRAEADRHVGVMLDYGARMVERCDEMMRGLDTGAWKWGPMMDACEGWDGSCGMMMMGDCDGGMMGDDGMMGR